MLRSSTNGYFRGCKHYEVVQMDTSGDVKPSPFPGTTIKSGFLEHMGHFLFLSCEDRIHIIMFCRSPDCIGKAPCIC